MTFQPSPTHRREIWRRRLVAIGAVLTVAVLAWLLLRDGGVLGEPVEKRGAQVAVLEIEQHRRSVNSSPVQRRHAPGAGDGGRRPLLVFLHGRGGDEDASLDDEMFKALAGLGRKAPVIAFPYGGDHSYWHDRADGAWGEYVTGEVIPAGRAPLPCGSRSGGNRRDLDGRLRCL